MRGQFLADPLALYQPGGRLCPSHYYAPPPNPRFSDLLTAHYHIICLLNCDKCGKEAMGLPNFFFIPTTLTDDRTVKLVFSELNPD